MGIKAEELCAYKLLRFCYEIRVSVEISESPKFRETLLAETDRNFTIFREITETDRNFAKQIASFGANPIRNPNLVSWNFLFFVEGIRKQNGKLFSVPQISVINIFKILSNISYIQHLKPISGGLRSNQESSWGGGGNQPPPCISEV